VVDTAAEVDTAVEVGSGLVVGIEPVVDTGLESQSVVEKQIPMRGQPAPSQVHCPTLDFRRELCEYE
jgi:hypothetical protein